MYYCIEYSGLFEGSTACADGHCSSHDVSYRIRGEDRIKEWHVFNAVFLERTNFGKPWEKMMGEGVATADMTNLEGQPSSLDLSPAYLKSIHAVVWAYLLAPDPD